MQYFGQYVCRMARGGKAIGPRGQGRTQNTNSGSVKPEVAFFQSRVRISCIISLNLDPIQHLWSIW